MTLLMALWASIYLAQRMLAPLRDLAEGTRAVSRGNYDTILPVDSADELGVLVDSFNRMTQEISRPNKTRWRASVGRNQSMPILILC